VQTDALHYQRYATDPAYKAQADAAFAQAQAERAAAERFRVAQLEREAARRAANIRTVVRIAAGALLAIVILILGMLVWLPQLAVTKARGKPVALVGKRRIADFWSTL
jgi:hypothetical protein